MALTDPLNIIQMALRCTLTEDGHWLWQGPLDKDGYGITTLPDGKTYRLHRVMLILHTGREGDMACHLCEHKNCCSPNHLYWGDVFSNAADMMKAGTAAGQFGGGEAHPNARLTPEQVALIRATPKTFGSGKFLAEKFGVSTGTISNIRSGVTWKVP